jgi:hypothetical protein
VFNSGGNWEFLFGKPLLWNFDAVHRYRTDKVVIHSNNGRQITLDNEYQEDQNVGKTDEVNTIQEEHTEQPKLTDIRPITPERIAKIQADVKIGDDITKDQRKEVLQILAEYADCFVLNISEVVQIPGAVHKLNIPDGATFNTRPRSPNWTPKQRKFIHGKVDEMLEAGIVRSIHPRDVKCVAPVVLLKKVYENGGLPIVELMHKVNDKCLANGMPPAFDLPPRPAKTQEESEDAPIKWRICQNFKELNEVTKIASMPQGDIRAKQLCLSGHHWIHVFDFAAGFHTEYVHEDSQPYITFYVEGQGFLSYQRMPFGVTGGPSEFAIHTADTLHNIVADGTIELFVDDSRSVADTFIEGLEKLAKLLEGVRHEQLLLSPSKLCLFMLEAVFAGVLVSMDGVRPDPAKLTAVVNWPRPEDASQLEGFLGLTGYFQDLIKGYVRIERPLWDILRMVDIPKNTGKTAYRRAMKTFKLADIWCEEHMKAFVTLKKILVSEPVV